MAALYSDTRENTDAESREEKRKGQRPGEVINQHRLSHMAESIMFTSGHREPRTHKPHRLEALSLMPTLSLPFVINNTAKAEAIDP